ncbi:hypothetical protein [Marinobacterium arenosum]|uniref:hypothetical protein n=1 Tax=Marinobacterium arenosum TaxID=2862496 RepID=UPI001C95A1E9|nr:hypothetical protein [Marinobacterium arenosum]MBY4678252.1 hypothetical protein [Marinobacterium arenosum]
MVIRRGWKMLPAALLLLVSLVVLAQPELKVQPHELVRLYNVRAYAEGEDWVVRGRVTRVDKDVRVPHGAIVVALGSEQYRARYKPQFVHRKTKRASYFTLRIPQRALADVEVLLLEYRPLEP